MTDLTPKQYAALKACADHGVPASHWSGTDELFHLGLLEGHDNDSWGEHSVSYSLSSKGRRALTIYENKHATVFFEDLRCLYDTVIRDSGDGSEQLHATLNRVAKVLGMSTDDED